MSGGQSTENRPLDWLRTGRVTNDLEVGLVRGLALLAAVLLIASFVSVLYHITDVVGGGESLPIIVLGAIVLGTASAWAVSARIAVILAGLLFLGGIGLYLTSIPDIYLQVGLATLDNLGTDVLGLLAGMSIIQIVRADLWAIAMAPAPIFLTWHLSLRRRYALSAWVGGLMLGFFVLTGDAGSTTTLLGTTSALGLLGFGGLDQSDVSWNSIQDVGFVLIAVVVISRVVSIVPVQETTAGEILSSSGSEGQSQTIEGSLIRADQNVPILGSISLSSAERFTITAEQSTYWHAGAYDRYTGGEWVRSGETTTYPESLSAPPGETTTNEQQVRAEATIQTMPAAWKPVQLTDPPSGDVRVTPSGDLQPAQAFSEGNNYTVLSEVPDWTPDQLRNTDTEYPNEIRERYLQVPDSMPDRVRRKATELTANAQNPYDTASVLQRWLTNNKEYSLDVSRPNGNIADAFIFEMNRGYCVYYATAMVMMLRTLGTPARFAVGYTPGERVADSRWVIRGYNSHAWVDVYFPEVGWVPFDPTPAEPRRETAQDRLGQARETTATTVDTDKTQPTTPTASDVSTAEEGTIPDRYRTPGMEQPQPVPADERTIQVPDPDDVVVGTPDTGGSTPTLSETNRFQPSPNGTQAGENSTQTGLNQFGGSLPIPKNDRDRLTILAGALGIGLGVYRFKLIERGYKAVRLRWQPRTESPDVDAVRAFERLEQLLTQHYRERDESETARSYLAALSTEEIDPRVYQVRDIYESAQYEGNVSRSEADEAIKLVDRLVKQHGMLR